ncbi:hypothetical protein [Halorarum halobium]|uniref:hypothetical protein n=1 Tax=Halorarum halobium TaxID=3075121 RepID=UPI0028B06ED0|nr:hypothetical protein [Halobaculum sp. XH14]
MDGCPEKQLEICKNTCETQKKISAADQGLLIDFSDRMALLKSEYTDYRHDKLLRHCTIIAEEVGGLAGAFEERDAAEDVVRWINRNCSTTFSKPPTSQNAWGKTRNCSGKPKSSSRRTLGSDATVPAGA